MTTRYATHYNKRATPQNQPITGENQAKNNAGGYVYQIDKWTRLLRFLILGTDGGTYYVKERELTRDNTQVVEACLAEDGHRTIDIITEVSHAGRAPKNDPAIFALALAASVQNPDAQGAASAEIRGHALDNICGVCRIPTHLFHFLTYAKGLRGFGRGLRTAIRDWYENRTPDQMAYQMVKYQARDGWSHADVLRQAHPVFKGADAQARHATIRWALCEPTAERRVERMRTKTVSQYAAAGEYPAIIAAFEEAKTAAPSRLRQLIIENKMSWEMVPSEALNDVRTWDALLPSLGLTAVLRNLAKMTAVGLLAPLSEAAVYVQRVLSDAEALKKARVHPMAILNALRVYQQGKGDKGSLTWKPVTPIVDALDAAFYKAFGNVTPTGKRLMLALDVSGSMSQHIAGTGLSCREAVAALALITANAEKDYVIVGFTGGISPLDISPRKRLDDVVRYVGGLNFGATDCSLPMLYATKKKMNVDVFCVYTDNETWAGVMHPKQALAEYRSKMGKPQAAQVVVGMTATGFSIADPADPRTLDVVGFDLATPEAISQFITGA